MFYALISIIGILLTIFFVIGTHESAHFFAARWLNVKVLRFSIGFGKSLFRWHDKKGTEYVLALIPLGGYVKMLDEREEKVPENELHLAFNRQPFYKKFLIVIAGPAVNILCALFLYWLIFMIGFTDVKPVIGNVSPHSIAAESGMKANQEIISIDNKKVSNWTSILFRLLAHAGDQDHVVIETQNITNHKIQMHVLDLSNWHMDKLTPDPLSSIGVKPYEPKIPLVIGKIAKDSPAAASSLQIGDKIIAVNHTKIKDWNALIDTTINHPDETIEFTIERKGKIIKTPVTLGYTRNILFQKQGYLGIGPHFEWPKELINKTQYGPVEAMTHAWQQIINFTYFNFLVFGKIIIGKIPLQSLGGPITIFETAGEAINYGFLAFISFLAFLSISIGLINILPIPGLDGGHLFIQTIEFIIRRPLPERILVVAYHLGFLLLIFLLLQALLNDILRLY